MQPQQQQSITSVQSNQSIQQQKNVVSIQMKLHLFITYLQYFFRIYYVLLCIFDYTTLHSVSIFWKIYHVFLLANYFNLLPQDRNLPIPCNIFHFLHFVLFDIVLFLYLLSLGSTIDSTKTR